MLTELAILGNFKYIEPMQKNAEQKAQTKYLITDKGCTQLINQYTTDNHTQIDDVPMCHNVYNQLVPWSLTIGIICLFI